jgi:hypothetical protein
VRTVDVALPRPRAIEHMRSPVFSALVNEIRDSILS